MTEYFPSLQELNAYLDGELDDLQQQRVEDCLQQSAELSAQLDTLRAQDRALRLAMQPLAQLPPNPALSLGHIRRNQQQKRWQTLAMCAGFLLCFMVGGGSGWYGHQQHLLASEPPMADAMETYRLLVQGGMASPENSAAPALTQTDIDRWFSQNYSQVAVPPELARYGLSAQHVQLIPTVDGPAAFVVYRTEAGQKLMFFARPPGRGLRKFLTSGEREEQGVLARYWSDDQLNYALVCENDFSQLPLVRNLPQRL